MNNSVKLLIVAAQGGARADLTAGWLGTLPGFLNGRWTIDLKTGVSYGNMGDLRSVDSGNDLLRTLGAQGLTLSAQSQFTWAVAIHGHCLNYANYKKLIDAGKIAFVSIDTADTNQKIVAWEFYVKTYLSHRLTLESLKGWGEQWIIGNDLSDDEKTFKLTTMLKNHRFDNSTVSLPLDFPCIKLQYSQLFRSGGSHYLCNELNIVANQNYHDYWDAVIPFTNSPESLSVWGHNWNRQDWFPD